MIINLIYIIAALLSLYCCIKIYNNTRHNIIIYGGIIVLVSIIMKLRWLNAGDYLLDITNFSRATVDIVRAILIIYISRYTYKFKKR